MARKTAIYAGRPKGEWSGYARVYRLSEPLLDESGVKGYDWVICSSVRWPTGPETLIFGCDSQGVIDNFRELPGSMRGTWDHGAALAYAGYGYEGPKEGE